MFVELVFFKAKSGTTDAEVLASAKKIQELATKLNSPFQLELLRTDDGEWVEIVHWPSRDEAERVEQTVMAMPEAQQAMSVMEDSSVRIVLLQPVQS
jgi:hypothetical protein